MSKGGGFGNASPNILGKWTKNCIIMNKYILDISLLLFMGIYFGHIYVKKNRKAGTHYDYIISCKGYVYIVSLDISLAK